MNAGGGPVRLSAERISWAVGGRPGLVGAGGAAGATAHGLFEVAVAAGVPSGIAWLYPLITDGLALVAYTATARLGGRAARYAWSVVTAAAGLSGLAQAVYLAGGAALDAPPVLRFGVGAWPAGAAAIVAHLLYLLAVHEPGVATSGPDVQSASTARPALADPPTAWPNVRPTTDPGAVQPASTRPALVPARPDPPPPRAGGAPARDRARTAAAQHARTYGALPTVSELAAAAEVSRGTAATALQQLRERPEPLHLITVSPDNDDDPTIEEQTQR